MRASRAVRAATDAVVIGGVLVALLGCGSGSGPGGRRGGSTPISGAPVVAAAVKSVGGRSADFRMDVAGQGTGTGTVSFTSHRPQMRMRMVAAGQASTMQYSDGLYFVSLTNDVGKYATIAPSQVGALVFEPITTLQMLAGGQINAAGVNQVENGHWRVDLSDSSVGMHPGTAMGPTAAKPSAHAVVEPEAPPGLYDVWINGEGYVDRIVTPSLEGISITISYSNWRPPVSIESPPPEKVIAVSRGMITKQMRAMGTMAGMGGDNMVPGG